MKPYYFPKGQAVQAEWRHLKNQRMISIYLGCSALLSCLVLFADLVFAKLSTSAFVLSSRVISLHTALLIPLLVLAAASSITVDRNNGTLRAVLTLALSAQELVRTKLCALMLWALIAKIAMLSPLILAFPWLSQTGEFSLLACLAQCTLSWAADCLLITVALTCSCISARESLVLICTLALLAIDLSARLLLNTLPWTIEPELAATITPALDFAANITPGAALNSWDIFDESWQWYLPVSLITWVLFGNYLLSRVADNLRSTVER